MDKKQPPSSCTHSEMIACDDDIPPLEDMSELVEQLNTLHEMKQTLSSPDGHTNSSMSSSGVKPPASETMSHHCTASVEVVNETSKATIKKPSSKSNNFGGFKKGFLFGSKTSTTSSSSLKPKADKSSRSQSGEDSIPLIRPKQPIGSQKANEIPEVQEAMKSDIPLLNNQDWITGDLLKKIEENPTLAKYLMDPRFSQALMKIQSDPKAAWDMLEGNAELQKVLKDFCGLMGDHLTKLGQQSSPKEEKAADRIGLTERSSSQSRKPSTPSSSLPLSSSSSSSLPTAQQPSEEDEETMKKILANPEIREALGDPEVQKLINSLKFNPDAAQMQLRSASPELRGKIRKLVDAGLLAFA